MDNGSSQKVRLNSVRAAIAVASAKGGTGKSALTVNLAAQLALLGRKVGIIDADADSPSILDFLGLFPRTVVVSDDSIEPVIGPLGLEIAEWNLAAFNSECITAPFPLDGDFELNGGREPELTSSTLSKLDDFARAVRFHSRDVVFLDLAPGISAMRQAAQSIELAGVIAVTHCSPSALRATANLLKAAKEMGLQVAGIIENMNVYYCDGCRSVRALLPRGDAAELSRNSGVPLLARLPFDPRMADTVERGVLFCKEFADSPLAKQIAALAQKLLEAINLQRPTSFASGGGVFAPS